MGSALSTDTESKETRPGVRNIVVIMASVLLAGIFLFAGVGKMADMGQMPGQTEYLDKLIPDFLYTPELARFIGLIGIPYILPVGETILGLLLLAGLWVKLDAIAVMLLSSAFMYHNWWMTSHGIDKFPDCACFGYWETVFGVVSPATSLRIDIFMFLLALVIIFVKPGGILSSQYWFNNLIKKLNARG
jgi:uncharacterized membrane protein YphA (DoxX/SURF4 family)